MTTSASAPLWESFSPPFTTTWSTVHATFRSAVSSADCLASCEDVAFSSPEPCYLVMSESRDAFLSNRETVTDTASLSALYSQGNDDVSAYLRCLCVKTELAPWLTANATSGVCDSGQGTTQCVGLGLTQAQYVQTAAASFRSMCATVMGEVPASTSSVNSDSDHSFGTATEEPTSTAAPASTTVPESIPTSSTIADDFPSPKTEYIPSSEVEYPSSSEAECASSSETEDGSTNFRSKTEDTSSLETPCTSLIETQYTSIIETGDTSSTETASISGDVTATSTDQPTTIDSGTASLGLPSTLVYTLLIGLLIVYALT